MTSATTGPGPSSITQVDLLVVGGGPAALSAATSYREAGGSGRVLMLSDEDVLPYTRPALSKDYLRGEAEESELPLESAEALRDRSIELRLGVGVSALLAGERQATLTDGGRLDYRHCVLATGATPQPLPVPGADHPAVAMLRSLHSARRLSHRAAQGSSAVVIGSGFIGCEAAASLARRGLSVTVVSTEELPQQARLGAAVGEHLAAWLDAEGVAVVGGAQVSGIDDGHRVTVSDGSEFAADLVLVAAGMRPNSELAADAGARTEQGRVVVDEHLCSSVPGLLAAGDVTYAYNPTAGRHLAVEHWGEALEMGSIAGATAAGADRSWTQAPGFWSTIGDRTLKYVAWGDGFDEARLRVHDRDTNSFTAWYGREGVIVGVATHLNDDDYDKGRDLVERGAPMTTVG